MSNKINLKSMAKCIFCGDTCIDDEDEEGTMGRYVGKQMICMGCLENLKEALGINELKEELGY